MVFKTVNCCFDSLLGMDKQQMIEEIKALAAREHAEQEQKMKQSVDSLTTANKELQEKLTALNSKYDHSHLDACILT